MQTLFSVRALLLSAAILGTLAATPHLARAQDAAVLQREEDDETRLRAWMAVRAARSPDVGWVGWIAVPVGTLAVGGGIALGVTQQDYTSTPGILTLPSALLIALGTLEVGLGLFIAMAPNPPREDYRNIPDRRLTEREIGRLEGILRHEASTSALNRTMLTWIGGGMALGGAGAMPLIAAFPPESTFDLTVSWGVAGGFALLGLVWFITSLFESPAEADWREYERGLMPHEVPQVAVRPTGSGFLVSF